MIVLDTNVVSELMRAAPADAVVRWARAQAVGDVHTTALTVAEVGYGIARLPAGGRRDALQTAADRVFGALAAKVLPFDRAAAVTYGEVVAERERQGRPISVLDAQIAAVVRSRGAVLSTGNTADFALLHLDLVDPWTAGR